MRPKTKSDRINWQSEVRKGYTYSDQARDVCVDEIRTLGYKGYVDRTAARLGVTLSKLTNHIRTAPWVGDLRQADPKITFSARASKMSGQQQTQYLEAELKAAARDKSLGDKIVRVISECVPQLPNVKPLWTPPKKKSTTTYETVIQFLSDWHGFEHITAERTRGLNEYTPEVMCQRAQNLVAAHTSIHQKLTRGGYDFRELVVALGGDFVSGTIHELEKHAHGTNIVLSSSGVAWLLAQTIRTLAQLYPKVYVVGVGGNHGRLPDARRKQHKDPTRTWDYQIYLMLNWMLADQENVQFWFPDAWAAQVEIRGWNFLLNHGDDIKSWGGIPWYGVERRTGKLLALEGSRGNVIHYQLLGHFHSSVSIPHPAGETFMNGSMIGGTEYSINELGVSDPPRQLMCMVHEDHGVTSRWPLRLDVDTDRVGPEFVATPWLDVQRKLDRVGVIPKWTIGEDVSRSP